MPLADVLDKIAHATGVPIHYSILPEGLVTATCVGSNVKQILECLFNKKADLIFRYRRPSKENQQNHPLEAWVLGARFDMEQEASAACVPAERRIQDMATNSQTLNTEDTDKLAAMATAKNPQYRTDAIANIAVQKQANNPAIHKILEAALSDRNAEVRAQAIFGLARQQDYDASAALQSALHDSDASVRLMAVDNAGDNLALLQQALSDSDETVRAYAAIKLETFSPQR